MIEPSQIGPARKRTGLTQTELAKRSGVSQSLIAKIEAGQLDPSFSKLKALSDALSAGDDRKSATAAQIMNRDVVLMYATEPVEMAIDHMARHGISQLPVFDEGQLVGTITEGVLLHWVGQRRDDPTALRRPVREAMAPALPQVPPETPMEALASMLELFSGVLVVANGRILGIVTKTDVLRGARGSGKDDPSPKNGVFQSD